MLEKLEPKLVWKNFEKICSIPHPSKHEAKIREMVISFGKSLNLETITDEIGNILIKKEATKGFENKKIVAMQAHIDMVPQKNSDKIHDFTTDPIEPIIDGEWVKANNTTLGADNGIGAAIMMAILEDKTLKHGPIECLFTIDEEDGMTGAFNLKENFLKAEYLINLDTEDEGEIFVGCAGGINANIEFSYESIKTNASDIGVKFSLTGLKGGHSGCDIHLGRGNANKLMNRVLHDACLEGFRISNFNGGSLRNAIPRESFVEGAIDSSKYIKLEEIVKKYNEIFKTELSKVEPDFVLKIEKTSKPEFVIDCTTQNGIISATYACPNGPMRMSNDIEGLVETSNNLAIIKTEPNNIIKMRSLIRSSVDSSKDDMVNILTSVFSMAHAKVTFTGSYPGWKPNMNSMLLQLGKEVYKNKYGSFPNIKAVHAGLECGLIGKVYPKMEMISVGPTIRYPHSPDEKVEIKTVKKFWDYLLDLLASIPNK